jgi:hypothetical protein
MSAAYQILYWRDIPAQIKVRRDRERLNQPLSPRFQEAIDEAAMRTRATSTDAYLDEWHASEWQPVEGDLAGIAQALASDLEAAYPPQRLEALKANNGYQTAAE